MSSYDYSRLLISNNIDWYIFLNTLYVLVLLGTSVEFQALLAEIKQKDKQREELLMKLKVC